jgi:hypothetical protein
MAVMIEDVYDRLRLTRQGMNAIMPLVRQDSEVQRITHTLYGVYTPSTGQSGALLMGTKEDCETYVKFYKA